MFKKTVGQYAVRQYSIWIATLYCFCCFSTVFAAPTSQQSVLVLSPDMINVPYLYDFSSAFKAQINKGRLEPVIVYTENLDLSHFYQSDYKMRLGQWLKEKYRYKKIDAVVVIGHTALNYLLNDEKPIWPNVPVLFTLASDVEIEKIHLPANVSGKTIRADFADIVSLAKSVLPSTEHIVLVGNVPSLDIYRTYLPTQIARMARQIDIIDLRGKPIEELRQLVSALPKDSVIYFTMLTYDSNQQKNIAHAEALEEIARIANRPILTDDPTTIGHGPLGVTSFDPIKEGKDTAQLVSNVLNGADVSHIRVSNSRYTPLLDWRQLERWGVDKKNLPPESELRFYTPPVWELYRWQILTTVGVITILLGLLIALLIERQRRAKAVEESRQRLAQVAHMNRKITASIYSEMIAHELIQPLAAILSNVEAAQMFLQVDPPSLDLVRQILVNIQRDDLRASDLIKSMRGLLKKSESEVVNIDLHQVIKNVLNFLAGEAKIRNVQLSEVLAPRAFMVSADTAQLQQVIVNLLLNGMDAIDEKGGVLRRISIHTTLSDKSAVLVCIADTGTGFDDNVERVFDSFFTTKPEGLGLGLSITDAIVQAHGGQIWVENGMEGGIVYFKLPLSQNEM